MFSHHSNVCEPVAMFIWQCKTLLLSPETQTVGPSPWTILLAWAIVTSPYWNQFRRAAPQKNTKLSQLPGPSDNAHGTHWHHMVSSISHLSNNFHSWSQCFQASSSESWEYWNLSSPRNLLQPLLWRWSSPSHAIQWGILKRQEYLSWLLPGKAGRCPSCGIVLELCTTLNPVTVLLILPCRFWTPSVDTHRWLLFYSRPALPFARDHSHVLHWLASNLWMGVAFLIVHSGLSSLDVPGCSFQGLWFPTLNLIPSPEFP